MAAFVFRAALADFLRARRIAAWVVVAVSLFAIAKVFVYVVQGGSSPTDLYTLITTIITFRLVALVSAIFSMAVIAQEVEGKTIVYLLTRPIPRWQLITLRTAAAILVVIGISWLSAIAVSLGVYGVAWNEVLMRDLLSLALGAAAYTSLFVLVSLLINRAMIVCLLFAFGWETLIPNMSGQLYMLSINSYLMAIAQHPAVKSRDDLLGVLGGLFGTNTLTSDTAWAVLALFVCACLAFSAVWFRNNEYIAREDAE